MTSVLVTPDGRTVEAEAAHGEAGRRRRGGAVCGVCGVGRQRSG